MMIALSEAFKVRKNAWKVIAHRVLSRALGKTVARAACGFSRVFPLLAQARSVDALRFTFDPRIEVVECAECEGEP